MGSTGENVAPSFVKKPQLRQEDDGNRLIFECKLAGRYYIKENLDKYILPVGQIYLVIQKSHMYLNCKLAGRYIRGLIFSCTCELAIFKIHVNSMISFSFKR